MPADADRTELSPGTALNDRLTVVRTLGVGGVGRVYEVSHKFTSQPGAAKVLHPQFARDAEVVRRFLQEAKAAAQIRHPNIVKVDDAGFLPDGAPYVLMELLSGQSLKALLQDRGPLEVGVTALLIGQVCAAIQAAHEKGIVHRDL